MTPDSQPLTPLPPARRRLKKPSHRVAFRERRERESARERKREREQGIERKMDIEREIKIYIEREIERER
jgi:hypothetical protein